MTEPSGYPEEPLAFDPERWELPAEADPLTFDDQPAFGTKDSRDPGKDRFTLTQALLAINVALVVALGIVALTVSGETWGRIRSLYIFVLTPFQTLLGIAIGYYFAERDRK